MYKMIVGYSDVMLVTSSRKSTGFQKVTDHAWQAASQKISP